MITHVSRSRIRPRSAILALRGEPTNPLLPSPRSLRSLVVLALFFFWALSTAAVSESTLPDSTIRSIVEHRLASKDLAEITVEVAEGVVTLRGEVATLADKEAAAHAAELREVSRVDNRLTLAGPSRSDAQISADVLSALGGYAFYDVFDWVEARVDHGKVALMGSVYQPWRREVIARRISRITGVRELDNHIEVQNVSSYDDQLRFQAANAIYGDLAFEEYAMSGRSPIHIIVNSGVITLEGVVRSRVEQRLAESLVRQGILSFGVVNHLRVSSEIPS